MSGAGDWEIVIGLEVHVQLATNTKIFCAAPAGEADTPNVHVDPVTLGMPGVLPVLNERAVDLALRVGAALGCHIAERSVFARKHYFYPDLPKGYQISQYDQPLMTEGGVWATVPAAGGGADGEETVDRFFPLTRIHMEEDAGKTIHSPSRGQSLVDYNRAGVPLVEIVSEPCMRSSAEAVAYLRALHQIVVAIGATDGNLEKGNFRCDANISIRPAGTSALGTKVEIKNVNSFRFVGRALDYEFSRQASVLESGGTIVQETRLWDEPAGRTVSMRSKEEADDYRYFPDPDLMVLHVPREWVDRVRAELPELPRARRQRYESSYGLTRYDAEVLTQTPARGDYFETVNRTVRDPKLSANWITGELLGLLNKDGRDVTESPVSAEALGDMLALVKAGTISGKMAKACFQAMVDTGITPRAWVDEHGGQITDQAAIDAEVQRVLDANPAQVEAFRAGKQQLLGFFVGQVMKATRGRANPQAVNEAVRRLLAH